MSAPFDPLSTIVTLSRIRAQRDSQAQQQEQSRRAEESQRRQEDLFRLKIEDADTERAMDFVKTGGSPQEAIQMFPHAARMTPMLKRTAQLLKEQRPEPGAEERGDLAGGLGELLRRQASGNPQEALAASGQVNNQTRRIAEQFGPQELQRILALADAAQNQRQGQFSDFARQENFQTRQGRTGFERRLNELGLPPAQRRQVILSRVALESGAVPGTVIDAGEGVTVTVPEKPLSKREISLLQERGTAQDAIAQIDDIIQIFTEDPALVGALGGVRRQATGIVGQLSALAGRVGGSGAPQEPSQIAGVTQALHANVQDFLGDPARVPVDVQAQARGFLADPEAAGSLEALEFFLAVNVARSTIGQQRLTNQQLNDAKRLVGLSGARNQRGAIRSLEKAKQFIGRRMSRTESMLGKRRRGFLSEMDAAVDASTAGDELTPSDRQLLEELGL